MPFFPRDGIRFHFREGGAGIPFFFQHGLGATVDQPFDLLEPPAGFRLIAFDCRAHGQTSPLGDPEKITIGSFADDLLALMEFLKLGKAVVGGISMGGAVALNFALRFPDRVLGLILQRPAWLAEPNRRNAEIFGFIATLIRNHGARDGAERFRRSTLYAQILAESPDCANSLLSQFANPRANETRLALERLPRDAPTLERADFRKVNSPVLVLANQQDPIHPFTFGECLAGEIPRAEFRELTPKSVSVEGYRRDTRRFISEFLRRHFAKERNSVLC